jgi:lipopolysaccharide transport system ATP-binding protein
VQRSFRVILEIECPEPLKAVEVGVKCERRGGQTVFISEVGQTHSRLDLPKGRSQLAVTVPGSFLAPGTYDLTLAVHRPNVEVISLLERLLTLHIVETGSEMWKYAGADIGVVLVRFPWSVTNPVAPAATREHRPATRALPGESDH